MACARAGGGWAVVAAPTTDDDAIIIIEEGQASALERGEGGREAEWRSWMGWGWISECFLGWMALVVGACKSMERLSIDPGVALGVDRLVGMVWSIDFGPPSKPVCITSCSSTSKRLSKHGY